MLESNAIRLLIYNKKYLDVHEYVYYIIVIVYVNILGLVRNILEVNNIRILIIITI